MQNLVNPTLNPLLNINEFKVGSTPLFNISELKDVVNKLSDSYAVKKLCAASKYILNIRNHNTFSKTLKAITTLFNNSDGNLLLHLTLSELIISMSALLKGIDCITFDLNNDKKISDDEKEVNIKIKKILEDIILLLDKLDEDKKNICNKDTIIQFLTKKIAVNASIANEINNENQSQIERENKGLYARLLQKSFQTSLPKSLPKSLIKPVQTSLPKSLPKSVKNPEQKIALIVNEPNGMFARLFQRLFQKPLPKPLSKSLSKSLLKSLSNSDQNLLKEWRVVDGGRNKKTRNKKTRNKKTRNKKTRNKKTRNKKTRNKKPETKNQKQNNQKQKTRNKITRNKKPETK